MCQTMHANTYVSRPLLSYMCHLLCMLVIIILTHPPVCPPLPQKRKDFSSQNGPPTNAKEVLPPTTRPDYNVVFKNIKGLGLRLGVSCTQGVHLS